MGTDPTCGYTKHFPTNISFTDAKARITDALKREGFGILTEIDVKGTLKQKLEVDFRQYVSLGACNPQLAHRALQGKLGIGLLLACNVCVWEDGERGAAVAIARPAAMFEVVKNPALEPIVNEADQRLRRALDAIA